MMADLPEPAKRPRKGKLNKHILLAMLYFAFVVLAIGGMMLVDYYGEAKMDATRAVRDAPEDH
jgi:quinol-cytochrome oxidoreductase complex cytochrome b subunit